MQGPPAFPQINTGVAEKDELDRKFVIKPQNLGVGSIGVFKADV
jgi:hypothetical protein